MADKSNSWRSIPKPKQPEPCKGLYNLNQANDLTTALCLAIFRLLKEKGHISDDEIQESIKLAMAELPNFRLQMMQQPPNGVMQ